MTDRKKIKAFVQDVLGCGCPEEVFQRIDLRKAELAGEPYDRINVGDRLLIYIFRAADPRWAEKELPAIVRAGKGERDARGFNRFRLVLATDAAPVRDAATKAFEKLDIVDDRVHLHVVDQGQARF